MPLEDIGVVGSRGIECSTKIEGVLNRILQQNGPFRLISGGADGPDSIAEQWARKNRLETVVHPADWENGGVQAGVKRNGLIISDSQVVIAFWDGVSNGTLDSIKRARTQKKQVLVYLC